ncbi:hypothetical protein ABZS66_22595 [Dactylosporangium sp. NPDC005572]
MVVIAAIQSEVGPADLVPVCPPTPEQTEDTTAGRLQTGQYRRA